MQGLPQMDGGDASEMLLRSAVDLLPSPQLRENDEAMCEMLETICSPQPSPPVWVKYGEKLQELGLYEAIYRVLRTSRDRPRVLGYAAKTLAVLASRDEVIQASLYSLPKLKDEITEVLLAFRENTTISGNFMYLLHYMSTVAGWHGKNKIVKLINALFEQIEGGFIYCDEDKANKGPMWRLAWSVLIKMIDHYIEYGFRDEDLDAEWAARTLDIIDRNHKHWECYYALLIFQEPFGQEVLRPMAERATQTLVKLVSWHSKGGEQRCESRLCSESVYEELKEDMAMYQRKQTHTEEDERIEAEKREKIRQRRLERRKKKGLAPPSSAKREGDWGHTIDMVLEMLTQLLLVAPKEDDEQGGFSTVARYEALLPAAMVAVDKYLVANPNIDLSAAQGAIDGTIREAFNQSQVVRMLMELIASHVHRKTIVLKACNLLFFCTFENKKFPTAELYLDGRGPAVLLKALEDDLQDESIEQLESYCTRFVAPLIILARKSEYKETILEAGYDVLLLLMDKAFELSLQVLIYLSKGSNEVKRRLREQHQVDDRILTYVAEERYAENPLVLKQVVDFFVGIKSQYLSRLSEFIRPEMLVAMAYYWTPRSVGRQLVFDPNPEDTIRVVTHVVRNLEAWIKAQWSTCPNVEMTAPLSLIQALEKGLSTTIVTLIWALPDDSPVWGASASCAFHLFRLQEQGAQERLASDWIRERKKAPYSPATLGRYKEYINHPSFDQGLWSFMESLFLPAFGKRGLDFSKEIIAPPPMYPGMQRAFGGVRPVDASAPKPKGQYVERDPTAKRCLYCHKSGVPLQRCGRCKQVYFCDRICQTRGWGDHKQKCTKK